MLYHLANNPAKCLTQYLDCASIIAIQAEMLGVGTRLILALWGQAGREILQKENGHDLQTIPNAVRHGNHNF